MISTERVLPLFQQVIFTCQSSHVWHKTDIYCTSHYDKKCWRLKQKSASTDTYQPTIEHWFFFILLSTENDFFLHWAVTRSTQGTVRSQEVTKKVLQNTQYQVQLHRKEQKVRHAETICWWKWGTRPTIFPLFILSHQRTKTVTAIVYLKQPHGSKRVNCTQFYPELQVWQVQTNGQSISRHHCVWFSGLIWDFVA